MSTELIERDGKTVLTATISYVSQEIRDAVIRSGMEHGAAESYDRLAELLQLLASAEVKESESHDPRQVESSDS